MNRRWFFLPVVDYPSFTAGCIAYEMLEGDPPFRSKLGAKDLFRKIMTEKVKMPAGSSSAAHKLLKGLLNRNPLQRWGVAKSTMFEIGGVSGLQQAAFFDGINWEKLERKEVEPPDTFEVSDDGDTRHFHDEFTGMTLPRSVIFMATDEYKPKHVKSDCFRGFSFIQEDFYLPDRDEEEVKMYWNSDQGDVESESECASSKCDNEHVPLEPAVIDKNKRPPRKRKKKPNAAASPEPTASNRQNEDALLTHMELASVSSIATGEDALDERTSEAAPAVPARSDGLFESATAPKPASNIPGLILSMESTTITSPSPAVRPSSSLTDSGTKTRPQGTSNQWQESPRKQQPVVQPTNTIQQTRPATRMGPVWGNASANSVQTRQAPASRPTWHQSSAVNPPPLPPTASPSDWTQHRMSPRKSPYVAMSLHQVSTAAPMPSWPSLAVTDPALPSIKPAPTKPIVQGAWAKR